MTPAVQLILTISSAAITILIGIVVTVIGFVVRNQVARIDKHDEVLNKDLKNDITEIKENIAAIKAVLKGGLE